jgi:acyl carrier protein
MNKKIIKDFIKSEFLRKNPVGDYDDDFSLIESGVIDSLGIQSLIAFLESTFGLQIDDLDLLPENFDSVNAITLYIEGKRA